jgi:hypothetical protein
MISREYRRDLWTRIKAAMRDQRGVLTDGVTSLNAANVPHKSGTDTITGAWAFTQSVGTPGGFNFVRNADLEVWLAGTSVAPTGWTLTGSGATVAQDASNKKVNSFAAAVTRVGNDCYLGQNVAALFGPAAWWQGKTVTVGAWVRATVASRARLAINDGVGTTNGSYHTGGSAFEYLTVTRTLNGAATQVEVRLVVDTGNTTAQFDGVALVLGAGMPEFVPSLIDVARGDVPTTIPTQWQFSLPVGTAGGVSWAFNGNFELWGSTAGGGPAANPPTGWTKVGAGSTVARDASNFKIGPAYAAALTRAGTNCYLGQNIAGFAEFGPVARWQGKTVTFGCWVRATVGSAGRLSINDGVGTTSSSTHTGGSAFEWLQVTRTIDASATVVELRCEVIVDTTVQFDGATLVLGASVQDFIPSAWRGRTSTVERGTSAAQAQATTRYLGPGGDTTTENQVSWPAPYKCIARNLWGLLDATPAAAQSVTLTLRTAETTDTLLATAVSNADGRDDADLINQVEIPAGTMLSISSVTSATVGSRWVRCGFVLEEIPE